MEIKSLPAVAKSIILWRARRKSRRLRSRGRPRPKDAIVIAPTTNFGFPPIVQLFACVSVPVDSRTYLVSQETKNYWVGIYEQSLLSSLNLTS